MLFMYIVVTVASYLDYLYQVFIECCVNHVLVPCVRKIYQPVIHARYPSVLFILSVYEMIVFYNIVFIC